MSRAHNEKEVEDRHDQDPIREDFAGSIKMAVLIMPPASPPRRVLATAVGTVGAMCGAVGGSASALFTTATSLLLVLLSYCIPLRRHSVKYCCNNDQKYLSDDEQTVPVIWLA